ncbi:MAG: replication initiation protein [Candidatus Nanoarchaeia archaeon]
MEKIKKFSDHDLVILGNNIIEARYDMTAPQLKLFIALISLIKKDDTDFKEYAIHQDILIDLLKIDKESIFRELFVLSKSLVEKSIYIRDSEKKKFNIYSIFSNIKFEDGFLIAKFNDKLRPFLLRLREQFTKFELCEFKLFKSKYSIRIYQLLKQYYSIGERTFDINDLRTILNIQPGELGNFAHFREFVIEVAQKELENTPMAFEYETKRRGKGGKVTEITFKLKNPKVLKELQEVDNFIEQQQSIKSDTDIYSTNATLNKLLELIPEEKRTNSVKTLLLNYLKQYASDYVLSQIQYTNDHKPKEWLAYLKQAIKEDYASYYDNLEKERQEKEIRKKEFERRLKQLEEERENEIEIAIDNEKTRIYKEYLDSLEDKEKKELLNEYLEKAKELYPEVDEKSFEMKLKVERLITEDIIAKNEFFQRRLEKAKIKAEERAQMLFELDKKKLLEQFGSL